MAEKTVISIEVDGVQKSINSVKELKDSISDLQKIAENADIGSERQKEAVKQIDNLNSQLKQLTQTEEQYAKSLEDVAKAEKEAIKETQDLRKQFEVLEDELFLLAGQGKQNTKEFRNLTIEAAALNKKIDAQQGIIGNLEDKVKISDTIVQKTNEKFDIVDKINKDLVTDNKKLRRKNVIIEIVSGILIGALTYQVVTQ
jgi:chromosome segregation ATPase